MRWWIEGINESQEEESRFKASLQKLFTMSQCSPRGFHQPCLQKSERTMNPHLAYGPAFPGDHFARCIDSSNKSHPPWLLCRPYLEMFLNRHRPKLRFDVDPQSTQAPANPLRDHLWQREPRQVSRYQRKWSSDSRTREKEMYLARD